MVASLIELRRRARWTNKRQSDMCRVMKENQDPPRPSNTRRGIEHTEVEGRYGESHQM